MERIGLFLCTGCDIGKAINVESLEELAEENGASTYTAHPCLCSPEGVTAINKAVEEGAVDGLLIAACSPRYKADVFRFDPTQLAVERVSLREHVAWTQKPGEEDTQMLAEDLLRMGLARVSKMELSKPPEETVERTVLVVGGGLAGLEATKAASGMGYPVVVVEATDKLGGRLVGLKDLVPEKPPYDKTHVNTIPDLVAETEASSDIRIFKSAKIKSINGQPGQFTVSLETPSGTESFKAGAIVQATGARPYDANRLSHLGYGANLTW